MATTVSRVPESAAERQPVTPHTLAELEQLIERGLETFVEVGHALREIRDRRLYQPQHTTFEAYLRDRWQPRLSRQHAHRLIQAAQVADVLSPIGDVPANEAQARELVPLLDQPETLRTVAATVRSTHGKQATAAVVRADAFTA